MAPLIRTPTVDRNGKATTVYRRADAGAGKAARALAGAAPALPAGGRQPKATTAVKIGRISADSRAVRVAAAVGAPGFTGSPEDGLTAAAGTTVEMDDAEVYAFLRLGIPAKGSALLSSLGIGSEQAGRAVAEHDLLRFDSSDFDRVRRGYTIHGKSTLLAIDAMEEAGIPAGRASKALTNGLQDEHFGRALDTEQLVELFGRWNFKASMTATYVPGKVEQDDVIDSLVEGRIPWDLRGSAMADLKAIEWDLRRITTQNANASDADRALHEAYLSDPAHVEAVVRKLLAEPRFIGDFRYSPVSRLSALVEEKGEGVLSLDRPALAARLSIDDAQFVEETYRLTAAADPGATSWPFANGADDIRAFYTDRLKSAVRLWDLASLRAEGFTPQQAYEALVVQGLRAEQAIAVHRDGIVTSLADGVL